MKLDNYLEFVLLAYYSYQSKYCLSFSFLHKILMFPLILLSLLEIRNYNKKCNDL